MIDFQIVQTYGSPHNIDNGVCCPDLMETDLIRRFAMNLAFCGRNYRKNASGMLKAEYISPQVICGPQEAFYAVKEALPIEKTAGRVCSEFVMCYPPGIPILAPGELITEEILTYIRYAKKKGCSMTGPEDMDIRQLNVMKEEP